jgi:cell wall-associated NlpC family hydrolase
MRRRILSLLVAIGLVMSVNVKGLAQPLKQKLDDQKEQLLQKQKSYTQFQMDFEKLEISIEMLDVEIEGIYIAIDKAKDEINITEKKIEQTEKDIVIAENNIKGEEALFNQRMRVMFMNGADSYLEILLDSKGLEDLVSRVENIKKIVEYDNKVISELNEKKKDIEGIKTSLNNNKLKVLALKANNEKKLDNLTTNKSKQDQLIVEAKKQQELYKDEIAKTEVQLLNTMNQIKEAAKQAAKEAAKKEMAIVTKKAEVKAASQNKTTYENNTNVVQKEETRQETKVEPEVEVSSTQKPSSVNSNELVAYAENFIGTPYEWGAVGPDTFDCSGFVKYVYAHFGVRLGRTTYDQIGNGEYVSRENLQPGDLVFFGTGSPHHVGIYVGDNIYIHAPRTGDVIKESPLTRSDYLSARRIN